MADQQIEDLSELTAPASADEILVNDDSDTTDDAGGSPKRMSLATLRLFASELTLDDEYNAGVGNIAKTLVVGKLTPVDLGANNGGTLAANCVITLPSASAGDVCGFFITRASSAAGSFAQAPGYCAELANATRVNDAAYTSASTGSGKWGLWLPGEMLLFRYLDTNYGSGTAGWYVMYDGRIPCVAQLRQNTSTTGTYMAVANTFYDIKVDTADLDNFAGFKSSTYDYQIKRAGNYRAFVAAAFPATTTDQEMLTVRLWNGTTTYAWSYVGASGANNHGLNATGVVALAANTQVQGETRRGTSTGEILGSSVPATGFNLNEIL